MPIDKRHILDEEIFTYQAMKDGTVFIFWHTRRVKILKGKAAEKFLTGIVGRDYKDAQLLMAKITGNFKRGNER